MKYDLLVNKNNPIDENFTVENLISVGKIFESAKNSFTNEDILLEQTAANALAEMLKAANTISEDIIVIPDSGYRSYQYQCDVLDFYIKKEGKEKAMQRVAMPGTSEHHTGLAVDIAIFDKGKYIDDVTGKEKPVEFLHKNSYKYGFILRYPKGKEDITGVMSEPWHFRYVGKKLAEYLYLNNLTLEEYCMKKSYNI